MIIIYDDHIWCYNSGHEGLGHIQWGHLGLDITLGWSNYKDVTTKCVMGGTHGLILFSLRNQWYGELLVETNGGSLAWSLMPPIVIIRKNCLFSKKLSNKNAANTQKVIVFQKNSKKRARTRKNGLCVEKVFKTTRCHTPKWLFFKNFSKKHVVIQKNGLVLKKFPTHTLSHAKMVFLCLKTFSKQRAHTRNNCLFSKKCSPSWLTKTTFFHFTKSKWSEWAHIKNLGVIFDPRQF